MPALGDENVRRFDIAVHNAGGVGRIQRIADFDSQRKRGFNIQRLPRDPLPQCHPFEEFHRDEGVPSLLANVVDCADVGMAQRGRCFRLPPEAAQCLRVSGYVVRQELECHESVAGCPRLCKPRPSPRRRAFQGRGNARWWYRRIARAKSLAENGVWYTKRSQREWHAYACCFSALRSSSQEIVFESPN